MIIQFLIRKRRMRNCWFPDNAARRDEETGNYAMEENGDRQMRCPVNHGRSHLRRPPPVY